MIPIKAYRDWYTSLRLDWKIKIAKNAIKDASLTTALFLSNGENNEEMYTFVDSIYDASIFLFDLIDQIIEMNNIDYEKILCQQLLISTSYALIDTANKGDEVFKKLQEMQMESLVSNDEEKAAFYEKSLKKNLEYCQSAKKLLSEWDMFTKEQFNLELFNKKYYA